MGAILVRCPPHLKAQEANRKNVKTVTTEGNRQALHRSDRAFAPIFDQHICGVRSSAINGVRRQFRWFGAKIKRGFVNFPIQPGSFQLSRHSLFPPARKKETVRVGPFYIPTAKTNLVPSVQEDG